MMITLNSLLLVLGMCCIFFVILFTLEGISENGWEGVKERKTIGSMISLSAVFMIMYILTLSN